MFLSVVILGGFTTETHAMAPLRWDRHAASYTTPRDATPRRVDKRHKYLSHDQVRSLAQKAKHPEIVLLLAYTGIRWGELAGLRRRFITAWERVDVDSSRPTKC